MARFTTDLTMTTATETVNVSKSGTYVDAIKIKAEVDNSDTPISLVSASKTAGQNTLRGCKALLVRNVGRVGVEIVFKSEEWVDASPDTNGGVSHQSYLISSGDFLYLPNLRQLNYETATTSAANGQTLDNQVPDGNMYVDSGAD